MPKCILSFNFYYYLPEKIETLTIENFKIDLNMVS